MMVALRKESVDRNDYVNDAINGCNPSLSARRAWIEMLIFGCWMALNRSLSARRAWIEIHNAETLSVSVCVALRKESVDRNMLNA